jgi:DNA repair exonuclease SbcCD nuclease subunit
MSQSPIKANGLLFIGDVHLSSQRPGRRKDKDYVGAILHKLEQAINIANTQKLVPIFTGDIFHWPKEPNESVKTRLLRVLGNSWTTCLSNVGNHDKRGPELSDSDTLAVVGETGFPMKVFRKGGTAAELLLGEMKVGLGFTPYDQEIPHDVTQLFPDAQGVVWITHHDIAFEGTYPGSLEPFEIKGCNLVINGHMHLEKAYAQKGETTWCNFGSLTRTAVDALGHEPAVWSFIPSEGLQKHVLEYRPDVFDLTGRLVEEISPGEIETTHGEIGQSAFVRMLEAMRDTQEPTATSDGTLLLEALHDKFTQETINEEIKLLIMDLFEATDPNIP